MLERKKAVWVQVGGVASSKNLCLRNLVSPAWQAFSGATARAHGPPRSQFASPFQRAPISLAVQWRAESSHGVCGGRSMPWGVDHDPSVNERFSALRGASIPRHDDASRQRQYGAPRLQMERHRRGSRLHRQSISMLVKMQQRRAARRRCGHCASCQRRRLTSARSPPLPTTSSRSPRSFARSLRYLSYRPQKHPRWHGRPSTSTAS